MESEIIERLRYYERQYLGVNDFIAEQTYLRDHDRRHDLSPHTWGIVVGLDIVEQDKQAGEPGVDLYISPGITVDGFGREIVLLEPYPVDEELFASYVFNPAAPDGVWLPLWIAYREETTKPPLPGYEQCDVDNQAARVRETFRLFAGFLTPTQLRDKVNVAGEFVNAEDEIPDASIPYQSLADTDRARWLIRLGNVRWLAKPAPNQPGNYFVKSQTPDEREKAREERQYIGAVAESILAPAETLRLRPRVAPSDPDATDFASVEGRLRVDGRVVAKKDVLVDGKVGIGTKTPDTKLHVVGGSEATVNNGSGYVVVGALNATNIVMDDNEIMARDKGAKAALHLQADGGDLVVHQHKAGTQVVVKDGGNVGVGTLNPDEKLHVAGDDPDLALDINSASPNHMAELRFKMDGIIKSKIYWDKNDNKTYVENMGTPSLVVDHGDVGIGTVEPNVKLHVNGGSDATLNSGAGYVVIGDIGAKNIVMDNNEMMARNNGAKSDLHFQADGGDLWVHYHQSGAQKFVVKDSGAVGIGTDSPAEKLDVHGRILRKGVDFSSAGSVNHDGTVSVPWGTRDDWNIFVSPRVMGTEEPDSEADNGMLKLECFATAINDTTWRVTARYKFKYWNDNPRTGIWEAGSANYLLVPR